MRSPRRSRALRTHLSILVMVCVVPLLIFAAIMMVLLERQERASVERGLRDTARALSVAVDNQLIASVSTLQALAAFDPLDSENLERFHGQAQRVLATQPGWRNIALHDRFGRQLLSAAHPFGTSLSPGGSVKMVRQALDTGGTVISSLFVGPVLKVPVVGVSVPVVRQGGALRYVLGARLDIASLGRVLSEGKLRPGWIAAIIDRDGIIVARTRANEQFLGRPAAPELVAQIRLFEEGSLHTMSVDGIPVLAVFSRSRLSGWSVALGMPDALVEAPGRRSLWALIGGGLVFLLIAGVLATTVGRRIARGIASLSTSAHALGEGKVPSGVGGSGITEVEDVEREMIESARERAEAVAARLNTEEALRDSEDRTHLIVSHALDAVITIDSEGRITSWNPQAESLFGWREDEAVGLLLTETVIPPAHREAHGRGLARVVAGGEGPLLGRQIELTALRRDGTEFPIELAITPMPIGGKIFFSAFLRDITVRKQREERAAELARLARTLTERLDMDTVTDQVVTSVVAVFTAHVAIIRLVEPDGFLRCVALAGSPLNEFQWTYRSPPGVGMLGRAVVERRPVWTSDVLSEPGLEIPDELRRAAESANNRAVLAVPLLVKEDILGVLSFAYDTVRTFSGDEIGLLQTFADQAALAIRNVQLFGKELRK